MTKRQLIDEIVSINQSAAPAFLAEFSDADLQDYLRHLEWMRMPRMVASPERSAGYSAGVPAADASLDQADNPAGEVAGETTPELAASTVGSSGNTDLPFADGQEESESWLF